MFHTNVGLAEVAGAVVHSGALIVVIFLHPDDVYYCWIHVARERGVWEKCL